MVYCCVPFCKSKKGKPECLGISFHEIPSSTELRQKWLSAISREGNRKGSKWIPSDRSVVCSLHFVNDDFKETGILRKLKTGSVPSLFSDYPAYKQRSSAKRKRRDSSTETSNKSSSNIIAENAGSCLTHSSVMAIKVEPLEMAADVMGDHQGTPMDNMVFIKIEPQLESQFEPKIEQGLINSSLQENVKLDFKEEEEGGRGGDYSTDGTISQDSQHSSSPGTKGYNSTITKEIEGTNKSSCSQERRYACAICGKSYSRRLTLKNHFAASHTADNSHDCPKCGKTFPSELYLRIHCRTHTEERKHSCSICGKSFTLAGYLRDHMLSHSGEKVHQCKECDKSFAKRRYLVRHLTVHEKVVLHSCPRCNEVFSDSHMLQTHISKLHDMKPFVCHFCNKVFTHRGSLVNHKRTHLTKAHVCETCGKTFTQRWHLTSHIVVHTGERAFACATCGKAFGDRSGLRTHIKLSKH